MSGVAGSVFAQVSDGDFGFIIVFWLVVGGFVGYLIGSTKGRSGQGLVLGLLLGVIGWVIVAVLSPAGPPAHAAGGAAPPGLGGARRPCPYCAEDIRREANLCRFCGSSVEPLKVSAAEAPRQLPDHAPANWNMRQGDYEHVAAKFPVALATLVAYDDADPIGPLTYLELKNAVALIDRGHHVDEALRKAGRRRR